MQQVVAANGFSLRVGQNREGVTGFDGQVARDFGSIHADGDWTHAGGFKLFQVFLYAS
jgi:hypothetical protein